jgi:DNA-binding response OmpR family regulator
LARLLVIDDEKAILDLVKNSLEKDGHIVTVCESAADVTINTLKNYDLILLDIMMPDVDGFMFCKKIRGIVDCPILFLTAKVMETDIIYGLGIGADDYITKPFRIGELRARVTAHLRRERREHHNTLGFEQEIKFDLSSKELFMKGKKVDLTKSEYEICEYLARNRGQVFTREQIYEAVFGFDGNSDNSTIATHIKNIRSKLAGYGVTPINTVWGVGYRWEG